MACPQCSPFSELAVQATSELLPLEPQVSCILGNGQCWESTFARLRGEERANVCSTDASQDLHHATVLCEVVYSPEETLQEELARLAKMLGLERQLTDVKLHEAAGQR